MAKQRVRTIIGGNEQVVELPDVELAINKSSLTAHQKDLALQADKIIRRIISAIHNGSHRRGATVSEMRVEAEYIREYFEQEESNEEAYVAAADSIGKYRRLQEEESKFINGVQAWCRRMQRLIESFLSNKELADEDKQTMHAIMGMLDSIWDHYHNLRLSIESQTRILETMQQKQKVTRGNVRNLETNLAQMVVAEITMLNELLGENEQLEMTIIEGTPIDEMLLEAYQTNAQRMSLIAVLIIILSNTSFMLTQPMTLPVLLVLLLTSGVFATMEITKPLTQALLNSKDYYEYLQNATGVQVISAIESLRTKLNIPAPN